jgi:hypothetical protein
VLRKVVTYRIRHAIARIADGHPVLGRHLRAPVRTGTWCSYSPSTASTGGGSAPAPVADVSNVHVTVPHPSQRWPDSRH